jgi:mannose-6-phosphate isomerase class I
MLEYNSQLTAIKLENNQVFKLPQAYREVQVLSGTAWITIDQKDLILKCGEKAAIPATHHNFAVISGLTKNPLIFKVLTTG